MGIDAHATGSRGQLGISYEESKIVELARITHAAHVGVLKGFGNHNVRLWSEGSQFERSQWIDRVRFCLANPHIGPEQGHEVWRKSMIALGWEVGETYNPYVKQDPDLVPFEELPENQKVKSHVFVEIVKAMTV